MHDTGVLTLGPRLYSGSLELTPFVQLKLYIEHQVPISSSPQALTTTLLLSTSKSLTTSSSISSPLKSEDKALIAVSDTLSYCFRESTT